MTAVFHAVGNYAEELSERFGAGWNTFWYQPTNPFTLCLLRILVGLLVLYWHLSFTWDLVEWFGPQGLVPLEMIQAVRPGSKLSLLDRAATPADLWVFHWLGAAAIGCFLLGFFTRVATVATLVVFLSYVHRGPMINGQAEPILSMLLLYLVIAPAGNYLSLDRLLRRARGKLPREGEPEEFVTATIATRLIQIHLAGFYLLMGLTKLGGEAWWNGLALWWLIARPDSRWWDFSFLAGHEYAWNLWTHLTVAFELLFPVLIWNRLARPLLLVAAVLVYVPLAMVTGLTLFFATLLVANLAYVSSATLRSLVGNTTASKAA
ncbi:MAG: hypothetical protein U0836_19640 [Pirellulales bacterium]